MHKHASAFLQAMARRAAARSKPWRPRLLPPLTKTQHRKFWWSVIAHHAKTGTSILEVYGKKFPKWLEIEVKRETPQRWLKSVSRKTGRRSRPVQRADGDATTEQVAVKTPQPNLPPKIRSKKRRSNPKREDAEVIRKRLAKRMEGVSVRVRKQKLTLKYHQTGHEPQDSLGATKS